MLEVKINNGWMPDRTGKEIFMSGGLKVATNILPISGAYLPVLDKTIYNSTAVSGTPVNGVTMQDADGTYYNFAGTSTKLYRFDTSNMTDITRASGGAYSATMWNFAKYGTWIIATNFSDAVQVLKDLTGANFVALGGSPPKAKYCLANSGHLILANIDDGTHYPKKIIWSARENVEDYVSSRITGSDSQEFPDMDGNITGIGALGNSFILAAQNSLTLGYYVGGDYTYAFKTNYVHGVGCFYPQSFISIGTDIFFWGKESVFKFDGEQIIDIGRDIKKTFFSIIDLETTENITTTHDKANGLIMWKTPDTILNYNYLENRFTTANMTGYCLFMGSSGGILVDTLTSSIIDDTVTLVDSNSWTANDLQPMVIGTDSKVNTFAGSSLTAEIETGEIDNEPSVLMSKKAYLPIDGESTSGSVSVKHRYSKTAAQTTSSSSTIKADGSVDLRTTDRYLALNIQASGFNKIGSTISTDITACGGR